MLSRVWLRVKAKTDNEKVITAVAKKMTKYGFQTYKGLINTFLMAIHRKLRPEQVAGC